MFNHRSYQLAIRTHLLTLEVATTGSLSLAASSTGYSRTSGSFVDDGFLVGMEVVGTGFSEADNNAAKTVTVVTALGLTCSGCVAESAAAGRTLAVPLPALRSWENLPLTPITGRPYVEEQYLSGPVSRGTLGPLGVLEGLPTYVLNLAVPANTGMDAARAYADALLTLFAPGTALTAGNGDVLRVRGDAAPFANQLLPRAAGWSVIPVTIPLRVRTTNVI